MRDLPRLVTMLTHHYEAWVVGSAADPDVEEPRDWDVIVPFSRWAEAATLIPRDAKVNSFGGWKCHEEGAGEIDVWPGELGWLMTNRHFKFAWNPRVGVRIGRIE